MNSKIILLVLILITVIAVVTFRNSQTDNSETIYVEQTKPKTQIKQKQLRTEHKEETFDVIESLPVANKITAQDRINHTKKVGSAFNKSLMYDTPEKTLKAIIYYQDNNQEQKAEEFIDYLIERFPNYDISDQLNK